MKQPFALSTDLYAAQPLPRVTSHTAAGSIGGVAPQGQTVGVRRDFGFTPLFLPSLTVTGGLRQPPRG
jgi:hypothetical protein